MKSMHFNEIPQTDSFFLCVIGTMSCIVIQLAELFIPFTLHILMPPIIPQAMTVVAGAMTLLVGYPHAKERIQKIFRKWLRK